MAARVRPGPRAPAGRGAVAAGVCVVRCARWRRLGARASRDARELVRANVVTRGLRRIGGIMSHQVTGHLTAFSFTIYTKYYTNGHSYATDLVETRQCAKVVSTVSVEAGVGKLTRDGKAAGWKAGGTTW
eukprot:4286866-Prymnesium_polylepis.1